MENIDLKNKIMITFEQIKNKEIESLFYAPIKSEDSINKTIKEIKRFWQDGFGSNKLWSVIVFTDNTALYLDTNHDATTSFICMTEGYTDRDTRKVSAYIRETGRAFINNGLANEAILLEAAELLKQFRIQQQEEERLKEIASLKKKLDELESI